MVSVQTKNGNWELVEASIQGEISPTTTSPGSEPMEEKTIEKMADQKEQHE